jgi:tyrosyl-tRNA synthetase
MDIETKIDLVKRKPTEEIVTEEDLRSIFQNYAHPRHYIGFEISGMVHVGSGLCTMLKINDLVKAGCKPMIWLADYHAWINGKFGGDLDKIQKIGEGYFKHAFVSLGLDEGKVEYKLASKEYEKHPEFWADTLRIAKDTTMNRMLRCVTIMGRKEQDNLNAASMIYPAMQAADIFLLDIQIAHAGMDQRKIHMLVREIAPKFKKQTSAIHMHLLPGLQGAGRMNAPGAETSIKSPGADIDANVDVAADAKMSKSKPDSAIFIHDSEADIKRKISKAFCPEKIVEGNPVVEYAEYLVLRDKSLKIERPAKFGGDVEFTSADELKQVYSEGKLHPMDLKAAVTRELTEMLKPSREYFEKHKEYLAQINTGDITR